jgi:hypothetical protein
MIERRNVVALAHDLSIQASVDHPCWCGHTGARLSAAL